MYAIVRFQLSYTHVLGCLFLFALLCLTPPLLFAQGNALFTDGTSYVLGPKITDSTKNITFECWLNPSSQNQSGFPFYIGNANTDGFGIVMHNGVDLGAGPYCSIYIAGTAFSATGNSARLPLNQWTHIAITRGDSIWHLYKNGELVGRGVGNPIIPMSNNTFLSFQFSGLLDEARFWNKERTVEEIRSTMYSSLVGNEPGLLAYYPMDTTGEGNGKLVRNKATLHPQTPNLTTVGAACAYVFSTLPFLPGTPPSSIISIPQHDKFFPRNSEGFATVSIAGVLTSSGYDSVILQSFKNDSLVGSQSEPSASKQPFSFSVPIHSELSVYTERLYAKKQDTLRFLREAADLVAGDVYLICGQSNSHPSNTAVTYESPYLRSYGIQTENTNYNPYDPADTLWGYANGHGFYHGFSGPYMTGVWGIDLQQMLQDSFKIPICVINGGAGASSIEQNIRNDANKMDLSTVYGRALYRATESGLVGSIKAIFWYQGESNTIFNYANNFKTLYHAWTEDYPSVAKYYVFQIRQGCAAGPHNALRELLRTLPDSLPHIRVMSTVGVVGHDGCHYSPTGYDSTATHIFRYVAQDFYGSTDTVNIEPPSVRVAYYTSPGRDTIGCLFSPAHHGMIWPVDTMIAGKLRSLKDYFYVGRDTGQVSSGWFSGDTLFLKLKQADTSNSLTYLPDQIYNDTAVIYEGPWLISGRGIGALTFANVPIVTATQASVYSHRAMPTSEFSLFPNPVRNVLTLSMNSLSSTNANISVCNLLGQTVLQVYQGRVSVGKNDFMIDTHTIPPGSYTVRVLTDKGQVTKGFVKEE